MSHITLALEGDEIVIRWLDELGREVGRQFPAGLVRAGGRLRRLAVDLTKQADAIGATRAFVTGWKFDLAGERAEGFLGELYNDAPHAHFAEYGRGPGRMPPEEPVLAWMRHRGIPEEFSFVIRRKIGERGTKGHHILEQVMEQGQSAFFAEMDAAFDRVLAHMQ